MSSCTLVLLPGSYFVCSLKHVVILWYGKLLALNSATHISSCIFHFSFPTFPHYSSREGFCWVCVFFFSVTLLHIHTHSVHTFPPGSCPVPLQFSQIYWLSSGLLPALLKGTLTVAVDRKESVRRDSHFEVLVMRLFTVCVCVLGRYREEELSANVFLRQWLAGQCRSGCVFAQWQALLKHTSFCWLCLSFIYWN